MSTTARNQQTRPPMEGDRKTALIAGALYIVTFVGSIPALALYHDILKDPQYVLGHSSDAGVRVSALLEIICALAGIGTAVVLHRVVRRYSPTRALGFVASRVWEAAMICVGVMSVLAIVTLHHDAAASSATTAGSLVGPARALVALHDWTFLVGPGLAPAISAMCLATVLYRSRLVPRIIPTLGLIGAPMLVVSSVATLFGVFDQVSSPAFVLALPIAVWEFSLGVWMAAKGFKPSPQAPESIPASVRTAEAGLVTVVA